MEKVEQDKGPSKNSASTEIASHPTPEDPAESSWSTLTRQLSTLAMTAIVGTAVGYYFQQRAWNNDKAVTKIQNDANAAFDVGQKVSEFIDARWAAADQLRDALHPAQAKRNGTMRGTNITKTSKNGNRIWQCGQVKSPFT